VTLQLIGPPPRRRARASWPRRPPRGAPSWPGPSALLCLAALAYALAGCGVKGPPRPPGGEAGAAAPAQGLPRPSAEPSPSAPPATAPPIEGSPHDPDRGGPAPAR
jgi:predicted small lipoprotein YifL